MSKEHHAQPVRGYRWLFITPEELPGGPSRTVVIQDPVIISVWRHLFSYWQKCAAMTNEKLAWELYVKMHTHAGPSHPGLATGLLIYPNTEWAVVPSGLESGANLEKMRASLREWVVDRGPTKKRTVLVREPWAPCRNRSHQRGCHGYSRDCGRAEEVPST